MWWCDKGLVFGFERYSCFKFINFGTGTKDPFETGKAKQENFGHCLEEPSVAKLEVNF